MRGRGGDFGAARRELWQRVVAEQGHSVECHTGRTHARGTEMLEALVDRADFVIVITDVNSHGGVQITRKLAVQRGRPHVLVRRLRPARLAELLAALPTEGGHP